jgi:hypothetical protein
MGYYLSELDKKSRRRKPLRYASFIPRAVATPPFAGTNAKYHGQLRSLYTGLCKYSHSASLDHMSGVHALRHFPTFDIEVFKTWTEHAREASKAMMSTLFFSDPDIYLKAHFQTQEVFDLLIPAHVRKRLLQSR